MFHFKLVHSRRTFKEQTQQNRLTLQATKSFTSKPDTIPNLEEVQPQTVAVEETTPPNPITRTGPKQYQPFRVIESNRCRDPIKNESDMAKKHVAMQHLQPSLLPEYYKPPVSINACMYESALAKTQKQIDNSARRFEESSTSKSVNQPLRMARMANPFPAPVKVMPSNTVSDQEKAEQMMADVRMAKSFEQQQQVRRFSLLEMTSSFDVSWSLVPVPSILTCTRLKIFFPSSDIRRDEILLCHSRPVSWQCQRRLSKTRDSSPPILNISPRVRTPPTSKSAEIKSARSKKTCKERSAPAWCRPAAILPRVYLA